MEHNKTAKVNIIGSMGGALFVDYLILRTVYPVGQDSYFNSQGEH